MRKERYPLPARTVAKTCAEKSDSRQMAVRATTGDKEQVENRVSKDIMRDIKNSSTPSNSGRLNKHIT